MFLGHIFVHRLSPSYLFDLGLLGVQGGLLRRDEAHQLGEVRRRRAALQTEKENAFLSSYPQKIQTGQLNSSRYSIDSESNNFPRTKVAICLV